jgi:Transglutaminase-like superfamily
VNLLRQFRDLRPVERKLLLRTFALVAAIRLLLGVVPFRFVRRLIFTRPAVSPALAQIPVKRLSWSVQASAKRIPGASCLTQALALHWLLARAGHTVDLRIGVAKDGSSGLASHAWLEHEGEILIGDNGELDRYSPILAWSSGRH